MTVPRTQPIDLALFRRVHGFVGKKQASIDRVRLGGLFLAQQVNEALAGNPALAAEVNPNPGTADNLVPGDAVRLHLPGTRWHGAIGTLQRASFATYVGESRFNEVAHVKSISPRLAEGVNAILPWEYIVATGEPRASSRQARSPVGRKSRATPYERHIGNVRTYIGENRKHDVLARDGDTCIWCGKTEREAVLHVHHLDRFEAIVRRTAAAEAFDVNSTDEAAWREFALKLRQHPSINDLDNLVTLCRDDCHKAATAGRITDAQLQERMRERQR